MMIMMLFILLLIISLVLIDSSIMLLRPFLPSSSSSDYINNMKINNKITNDIKSYMNLRASSSQSSSSSSSSSKKKITNNDKNIYAVWHYNGVIKNPVSGIDMVGIEGIEIIKNNGITRNHTHICSEYITKKAFIYTDKTNTSKALYDFRFNPQAPKRIVNPVKIMTEKITIQGIYNNGTNKNTYNCIIEWPNGRKISTKKIMITSNDNDRTIIDRLLNRGLQYNIVNSMNAGKKQNINKWISFSGSNSDSGRTNEYYTYSSNDMTFTSSKKYNHKFKPSSFMTYKRYGESPSWLALGRSLTTELIGYKYSSLKYVPYNTVKLIKDTAPEFFKSFYEADTEIFSDIWFNKQKDLLADFKPFWKVIHK